MDKEKEVKKEKPTIRELTSGIWYNLPYPGGSSTWGACRKGCGRNARGAGQCVDCAEKTLAAVVGGVWAFKYVAAVKTVRELERRMCSSNGEQELEEP
jgi:hypothetical protein